MGDRVEPADEGEGGAAGSDDVPPRCVRQGGMSLHADVSVPARDRRRLERLCRYAARPPLALERLEAMGDGRLAYRLKTRWRDGTTHVLMERRELLERLAPLIPPPRAHQVRYHGILAPSASGRDRVVPGTPQSMTMPGRETSPFGERKRDSTARPMPRPVPAEGVQRLSSPTPAETRGTNSDHAPLMPPSPHATTQAARSRWAEPVGLDVSTAARRDRRLPWSKLLQRVFGIDALQCQCGKPMRVLAAITEPAVARRILDYLSLPPLAPPLTPASAPDWVPDPWLEHPGAADFDQTPPEDWDTGA